MSNKIKKIQVICRLDVALLDGLDSTELRDQWEIENGKRLSRNEQLRRAIAWFLRHYNQSVYDFHDKPEVY